MHVKNLLNIISSSYSIFYLSPFHFILKVYVEIYNIINTWGFYKYNEVGLFRWNFLRGPSGGGVNFYIYLWNNQNVLILFI